MSQTFYGIVNILPDPAESGLAYSGGLKATLRRQGDGLERAVVIARRDSISEGGQSLAGDGVEYLIQMQDTAGNYGNVAGFIGRILDPAPGVLTGRVEIAVKEPGAFNATFDNVKMIIDHTGKVGISDTFFRTIAEVPGAELHIKRTGGVSTLLEATNVAGLTYGFKMPGQQWNMSVGADKKWRIYDATAGVEQLVISPTSLKFGPMVAPAQSGKRYLVIDANGVVTSQATPPSGS